MPSGNPGVIPLIPVSKKVIFFSKRFSGYTTVKNSSLINCVICGVNAKRKFSNITEYKQHLAIFHFRNQVSWSIMFFVALGMREPATELPDFSWYNIPKRGEM
jgi:hypothetical protein